MDDKVEKVDEHKENQKKVIFQKLENGIWKKDAALLAGISEATFYRWVEEDKSFKSQVEAAILRYKEKLITSINLGTIKDARHAFEVLRTRYPDEWNVARKIEHAGRIDNGSQEVATLLQELYAKLHGSDTGDKEDS